MNQKFTRKELSRLGCKDEEIVLVIKCQKVLPIIFDNDEIAKFCVDARLLWKQLNSKRQFSDWIKQKINKSNFKEGIDFHSYSQKCEKPKGGRPEKEYEITMRMAQHLCLLQNNNIGSDMRDYFCLMEDIVKRNKKWCDTRNPQKANYLPMCESLSNSIFRIYGRCGDSYDFSREANIINIIATGSKAQTIRNYLGIQKQSELTRDSLENDYNEKISFLQDQNILLIGMDMKLIDRVKLLIKFFDIKYPIARPILPYLSREGMEKARDEIIKELEI